ncbi:guanylate kinase [Candidatus Parcubacteria bacterium]|nr:guanylate kinase [Candidatus Parcubacteria bacterium]
MLQDKQGKVFMVVGPSAVGKTTLIEKVRELKDFGVTVSCTTRKPRDGEVDGKHYHFIIRAEFMNWVERGLFAEWAQVHGNFYGTLLSNLESLISSGKDVIFDLDVQGAKHLKARFPEFQMIFIAPPSLEELRKRLMERNSGESPEELETRLNAAVGELHQAGEADWVIKNVNLNQTASFLNNLIADISEGRAVSMMLYHNPTLVRQCVSATWETVPV